MFKSKTGSGDIKRLARKLVDLKKTTIDRLKYIRALLHDDDYEKAEIQALFEDNYPHIYYIFFDMFVYVENERKSKGFKAHKDDFDFLLILFEKILVYLPRLVKKRWQFHSMRRFIKSLLHIGNSIKVRKDGIRLFMMWYQILQDNNDTENHQIFSKLVTLTPEDDQFFTFSDKLNVPSANDPVCPVEILPVSTQERTSTLNKHYVFLTESLLTFMVSEVAKIEWRDPGLHEASFRYLFNSLKKFYLQVIFPHFDSRTSVYTGGVDQLPEFGVDSSSTAEALEDCQDVVIRWFANFVLNSRMAQHPSGSTQFSSFEVEPPEPENTDIETDDAAKSSTLESKTATLTNGTVETSNSGESLSEHAIATKQHEIVYKVLLGDKENVDIVHEVFRQAFMLPLEHAGAIRRVVLVYKDWLQLPEARPAFMKEPLLSHPTIEESDEVASRTSDIGENTGTTDSQRAARFRSKESQTVRAGLQNSLLLFIKHSAYVFMVNPHPNSLSMQHDQDRCVDLCRRVLNIYRHMVMNIKLNPKTWEQLLVVLLKISQYVLGQEEPVLGKHLAASLLQTLVVSWIKANLCIQMPENLWDQLLSILSSLHHWPELIKEWAKTMETLTRVLAKQVYKLDLNNLPLDRLTEQKQKRQRAERPPGLIRASSKKGTFSRAYSRFTNACDIRDHLRECKDIRTDEMTVVSEGELEWDDGLPTPGRGRSFTEINPEPRMLLRSNSDGKLTASNERLKSNGSIEELENDTAAVKNHETITAVKSKSSSEVEVTSLKEVSIVKHSRSQMETRAKFTFSDNEDETSDEHIPFAIDPDTQSQPHNLLKHSLSPSNSRSRTSTTDMERSVGHEPESPMSDSVSLRSKRSRRVRHGSEGTSSFVSDLDLVDGVDSDDTSIISSTIQSDYGSIPYSEMTQTLATPLTEGSRSPSNSPVSMELAPYLHGDASFLKKEDDSGGARSDDGQSEITKPENLVIEEMTVNGIGEVVTDYRSVLTGGQIPGWSPEVAVVVWRRMLGCLGDINSIKQPSVHRDVFSHLIDLQTTLIKLLDNLCVSEDNSVSIPPGELTSPILHLVPLCVKCLELDNDYLQSKLIAIQIMCKTCLRWDYLRIPPRELGYFYRTLHQYLTSTEQSIVNTLVRHVSPLLFGLDLPGSTLFIMKSIKACATVLSSDSIKNVPRREAISLLGTLVCYPNHYDALSVLMQDNSVEAMESAVLKDVALPILLDAGRKEPAGAARCVALCSLTVFVCEEILHGQNHPRFKEAVNVLLVSLRFNTKLVGWVACSMLQKLSEFVPQLESFETGLPSRILGTIVMTLNTHMRGSSSIVPEENLVVSIMFCLFSWCLAIPVESLTQKDEKNDSLINKVVRVLLFVMYGSEGLRDSRGQSIFSQEYDLESMLSVAVCTNTPVKQLPRDNSMEHIDFDGSNVVSAAHFILKHLVNHIGQYPAPENVCTRSFSNIQECSDLDSGTLEMNKELLKSPNLQMFVCNQDTLISVLELEKKDVLCTLSDCVTPQTTARIIIRDVTGKYSWSSTLIHEVKPPGVNLQRSFSYTSLQEENLDSLPHKDGSEDELSDQAQDPLVSTLNYIAETSPECQLTPGEPLAEPAPALDDVAITAETKVIESTTDFTREEEDGISEAKNDFRHRPLQERPPAYSAPDSPFSVARQFLQQMGYLAWDSRQTYALLEKNDKLLREIKHLDSQRCRETHKIAVIYVAEGQEDKLSILSNAAASPRFEQFVSGLGWEVDLATHEGFMGGLQPNGSNGATAPFHTSSVTEVLFHVTTRMPSETEDDRMKKLRHIGNDEIHIVWCEHYRPYRRGIIPTDFGDVLIVIYPLQSGLFRVQIDKKAEIQFFGPLYDGAIVSEPVLATLVRSTAINASRTHRLNIPHFKPFYQVRSDSISSVADRCKLKTTFETYAAGIFAPSLADPTYISKAEIEGLELELEADAPDGIVKKEDKDDLFAPANRMIRRLSMRNRKSVPKSQSHSQTPPDSPNRPKA